MAAYKLCIMYMQLSLNEHKYMNPLKTVRPNKCATASNKRARTTAETRPNFYIGKHAPTTIPSYMYNTHRECIDCVAAAPPFVDRARVHRA